LSTYATTLQLARFMNVLDEVPSRKPLGQDNPIETVGIGDNSNTLFYLDKGYILASSYTLYYGTSASASIATPLTETTHYALDKDTGVITLTTAGVTLVSTNNIYAAYNYCSLEVSDTQFQEALDRAQDEIDELTGTRWATGTDVTPDYAQVTDEKHAGKGKHDKDYYADYFPVPNVTTQVSDTIAAADTYIPVDSTSGFPSTGYILIGTDKITYTGKTTTQFTGCTSVGAAHSIDVDVYPMVIEISTTGSGSTIVWTVLQRDTDYDVDLNSGRIHLYKSEYDIAYYSEAYPPKGIPNRLRFNYVYGHNTIPKDITRLCLMIATKDLMHSALRRSIVNGSIPERMDTEVDEAWIEKTLLRYTNIPTSNI